MSNGHTFITGIVHVLVVGSLVTTVMAEERVVVPVKARSAATERHDRGRYLVKIAGCNDCHTPGYAETGGKIPEKDWLTGDRMGWRGPWGTTYASNLRLYMQLLSEEQWVKIAHTAQFRPPMPWFALHDMTEQDLRAMYRFIKSLEPAGKPAPAYLPPEKEPEGPYILFPQTSQ
ncbi:MAG: cytochrome C [Nitrospiraceae bacterium]|nr:MAG: cytochrome C [Nitrospiraceae bacterium]